MSNKIAIIGIANLLPGAETPAQFWELLKQERSTISEATLEQTIIPASEYLDPEKSKADHCYNLEGGYIKNFKFDPQGFELPAEFLSTLDNLVHWSLYTGRAALEDCGYWLQKQIRQNCGLILGNLSLPTQKSQTFFRQLYGDIVEKGLQTILNQPDISLNNGPSEPIENGFASHSITSLLTRALGISGPHFSLDAACASSIYALKFASDLLLARKTDLMLVGGVNATDVIFTHLGFSAIQAYDHTNNNRPFDQQSRGLAPSEGSVTVVLKRYADAIKDQDKIYGLIAGIGLANDGRGKFLLSPNPKGQKLAYQRAYEAANISPAEIDYLECHATGTPLGDKTELSSLEQFFQQYGDQLPKIGSVKANIGHLLSAAGLASLVKILLSFAHEQIPATIKITEAIQSPNNLFGTNDIIQTMSAWPQKGSVKRAALTAFGFGGVDAHIILEESSKTDLLIDNPEVKPATRLAIVGMGAHFAGADNVAQLEQTIYLGKQHFTDTPNGRWHGVEKSNLLQNQAAGYIDQFEIDFRHFRIPPHDDQPIPQQLLMLKTAEEALQDAAVEPGGNVAILICMETDLILHQVRGRADLAWQIKQALHQSKLTISHNQLDQLIEAIKGQFASPTQINRFVSLIGNIIASRIAAKWDFSGPVLTISAGANGFFRAVETAQLMLTNNEVDGVLIGAVDLAAGLEYQFLQQKSGNYSNPKTVSLSINKESDGSLPGEGAGAVYLERLDFAQHRNAPIYAELASLSTVSEQKEHSLRIATQTALTEAAITADQIGYLELSASGKKELDEQEIAEIMPIYSKKEYLSCAIGSIKTNIGDCFTASPIASLIKATLCLHQRYLPTTPNWSAPKTNLQLEKTSFYIPTESQPWFTNKEQPTRLAALNHLDLSGEAAHLILQETKGSTRPRLNQYLCQTPPYLFPLAGNSAAELIEHLRQLETDLHSNLTPPSLCRLSAYYGAQYEKNKKATYAISLIGINSETLQKEIQLALKAIPKAIEKQVEWKTPQGSCFVPTPLGPDSKIAFVYPGGFNSYIGLGKDLFHLCPELLDNLGVTGLEVGDLISEQLLYPRTQKPLTEKEILSKNIELTQKPIAMLESAVSYSRMTTKLLLDYFGVKPDMAVGYSLGETSMLFALGAWQIDAQRSTLLRQSPLFQSRLAGPQNAIREAWNLPNQSVDEQPIWQICLLRTTAEKVRPLLAEEPKLFLTLINSPRELVVAGDPAACQRIISKLKCAHFIAPYNYAIHCPPMESEWSALKEVNHLPLNQVDNIKFYFATQTEHEPVQNSAQVAEMIATGICQPLNFPKLIDQLYQDEARIFIELGAGGTCARWIKDSLKDQPHLSLPFDKRGHSGRSGLIHLLAQLITHRIPVTLNSIYRTDYKRESESKNSLWQTIKTGGKDIFDSSSLLPNLSTLQKSVVTINQLPHSKHECSPTSLSHAELLQSRHATLQKLLKTSFKQIKEKDHSIH